MGNKPAVVYSNVWEDPELNRQALQVKPGQSVLSITSGGCNSLCLLLEDPSWVVSIDLNPAQLAMLELKRAAMAGLGAVLLACVAQRDAEIRMRGRHRGVERDERTQRVTGREPPGQRAGQYQKPQADRCKPPAVEDQGGDHHQGDHAGDAGQGRARAVAPGPGYAQHQRGPNARRSDQECQHHQAGQGGKSNHFSREAEGRISWGSPAPIKASLRRVRPFFASEAGLTSARWH